MTKKLEDMQTSLQVKFKNPKLLENVFVHRSYLNENKDHYLPSNEKLEFLGDSVLSLITSIYLYKNYPQLEEGEYTDIKAKIVRTGSLAKAADKLNLGSYLFLSKGEEQGKGRTNVNLLADCFEALIAAIFIDHGFNKAYDFVLKYLFGTELDYIIKNKLYLSAKSKLQEYSQAKYKFLPVYKILEEKGPEHDKFFRIATYINNKNLGEGIGKSKKQAEENAAKNALKNLR